VFLVAKPIGWFLRRYAYRWLVISAAWLILLVVLFPFLWLAQQASNAGGWVLGVAVLLIEIYLLAGLVIVLLVASVYRFLKGVRTALGLRPPDTPRIIK